MLQADYIVVDSVSRVPRFGGAWELPGQSGNTERIGTIWVAGTIAPTSLISMYRKADIVGGKYKSPILVVLV